MDEDGPTIEVDSATRECRHVDVVVLRCFLGGSSDHVAFLYDVPDLVGMPQAEYEVNRPCSKATLSKVLASPPRL